MTIDGKKWHCSGNTCYHFEQNTITKNEADDVCRRLGGHVVAIETAKEQQVIEGLIDKYGKYVDKYGIVYKMQQCKTMNLFIHAVTFARLKLTQMEPGKLPPKVLSKKTENLLNEPSCVY